MSVVIDDPATLRDHMGPVSPLAARKVLPRLDPHRRFIELSPSIVLATADTRAASMRARAVTHPGVARIINDSTLLLIPTAPAAIAPAPSPICSVPVAWDSFSF